ncbi:hypothetical protein BY458DRAFT_495463, partial [Sporodiniella umbellata]
MDIDRFIFIINKLFDSAAVKDDDTKTSIFISSVKPSIAKELEKNRRHLKSYKDITEEAIILERINNRFDTNHRNMYNDRKVTFDTDIEKTKEENEDRHSIASTIDSLSELVKGMQLMNINMVKQQQDFQKMLSDKDMETSLWLAMATTLGNHHMEKESWSVGTNTDNYLEDINKDTGNKNEPTNVRLVQVGQDKEKLIYAIKRKESGNGSQGSGNPGQARKPRKRTEVEVPIERPWDKMKNTQITMSMAEYLSLNKENAKEIKDGLMYLHRRKSSRNPKASLNTLRNNGNINILRTNGLLDEEEYQESIKTYNTSVHKFEENSEYSDQSLESDSEWEDSGTSDVSSTSEEESICDYSYSLDKMKQAQPLRVMISINNRLVEAILDSGAAVSVMCIKLADKLNLRIHHNEKIPLSGFGGNRNIYCSIAPNVDVRIAGRRKIEHFCIDKTDAKQELCLLGNSWICAHDITITKNGQVLVIPINNKRNFIEVATIKNDEVGTTSTPIYQVHLKKLDDTQNLEKQNFNPTKLNTYQEDIISDGSMINDCEEGRLLTGKNIEIPDYVERLLETNKDCFVEYNGLGR